ncbi:MAG: tRNA pseudouridine(38-40) synthase TruA [Pseudomonadales bacterium]|nr:tRNA pseudouridine(38-40) synthase TruA [Pseudomonadales bacterium]MCP5331604.1 tRNA pseudouridine(38-40) synthase TruA [Pseudomonadales bacterium]MCP5344765.1 tRNA pseudouridine(38-40) synthase TruA [Pseudomonadales bacterium]
MSTPSDKPHRIAVGVEYDGTAFFGWQRQEKPAVATVQLAVENALAAVADHPVSLVCAGRTDAGVHASGQVAHFQCAVDRGEKAWVKGSNSQLPPSVRIVWARAVSEDFHARFSALHRRYHYVILDSDVASASMAGRVTHTQRALNIEKMHEAGQFLLGEHDFSAFRAASCQSPTPVRRVTHLRVLRHHRYILLDIQANAFLHHMVRNIAGTLMEIGEGKRPPEWAHELLQSRDRKLAGMTARPEGLYLVEAAYPAHFGLPSNPLGPVFLQPFP